MEERAIVGDLTHEVNQLIMQSAGTAEPGTMSPGDWFRIQCSWCGMDADYDPNLTVTTTDHLVLIRVAEHVMYDHGGTPEMMILKLARLVRRATGSDGI